MEVLSIGRETAIGKIEKSLAEIKEKKTPIQVKLEEFSKDLGKIILIVCLFIFLVGLLYRADVWEMFRFSIILAVAAIPEGLPIAVTVILALGMRRILKRNGLVKRLASIETLGSTSVICTDKTGTLTEGKMKVAKTDFSDKEIARLALILNNEQRSGLEVAIWDYIRDERKVNPQEIFNKTEKVYEEPQERFSFNHFLKNLFLVFGSGFLLLLSAQGIVQSSVFFANYFNLSLSIIGILIIALGTSLPETSFALQAARKSQDWLILGNLMGSVVITTTLVLGTISLLSPIKIADFSPFAIARFFLVISALFFFFAVRTGHKITRKEALFLILIYFLFVLAEILIK